MKDPNSPILILDSGLGGLTVARALRARLPGEDLIYFGDTARLPYGSKTAETVTGFIRQILQYLRPSHPKHVVIACNTATALSLPQIRAEFRELSISGVIEPGAKAAALAAGAKAIPVIGVIATEATVRSKAYERAIHRRRNHAHLLLQPTPLLVPLIEEGRGPDDPVTRLALKQYLTPLVKAKIDVLVLGCTHYPILKPLICSMVGPRVKVIDSAEQCADDVARQLEASCLLHGARPTPLLPQVVEPADAPPVDAPPAGSLRCFVTDDAARFARLASRFLGVLIQPPTLVSPDTLYGVAVEPVPVRRAV